MINEILSFGYLPAVVLTGYWLLSNPLNELLDDLPFVGKLGLSVSLGILAWFPLLFVCAWFNVFKPHWIGLLGWLLSFGFVFQLRASGALARFPPPKGRDLFILGFAGALFAFNAFFVSESILGGRDQGVYATHGAHIAKTGMLKADLPYERLYDKEFFSIAGATNPNGYMYDIPNGNIFIQFPSTFALHLAQFFGIGDYEGLLLFNPLIASLSLLSYFALASIFMRFRWAILASLFYALNASQVWNARITLSEMLAQNILFSGLLIAVLGYRKTLPIAYCLGCAIVSSVAFTRVDGFLFPSFIAMANALLFALDNSSERSLRMFRAAALATIVVSLIAYGYNAMVSPAYFADFSAKVQGMILVSVAASLALFLPKESELFKRLKDEVASESFVRVWMFGLAFISLYAYFIRPYIEPFAQFENPVYGTRNYRENSLIDLSKYLSFPIIAFAVAGACIALRRICRGASISLAILFIPWIGFSLIYLFDPQISPDHIWRIRRFTPVIIPGAIFFAAWAISILANETRLRKRESIVYATTAIWLAGFAVYSLKPIAFLKQYEGTLETVRSISSALPEGSLTLANVTSQMLGPLQLAEGRKMIRETRELAPSKPTAIATKILETEFETGRELFILSQHPSNQSNVMRPVGTWEHNVPHLKGSYFAPAKEIEYQKRTFYLSRLTGKLSEVLIDQSYFDFGAALMWNVDESGMHGQEYNGPVPFRWTTGDAAFTVSTRLARRPLLMAVNWTATKPDGSNLQVFYNDVEVHNGPLPATNGTISIPLDGAPFREVGTTVRFVSNKWIPSDTVDGSQDGRTLGIAIEGVTLFFDERIRFDNAIFGNFPVRGIDESGFHPVEVVDGLWTRWTSGRATFDFALSADAQPANLILDIEGKIAAERPLSVKWNGRTIYEGELPIKRATLTIPIVHEPVSGSSVSLEILTRAIVPSEIGLNSDVRALGARIYEMRIESK